MPFDIHDPLLDDEGYLDEDALERYQHELLRLFEKSTEAHEIRQPGISLEWAELMLDFALNNLDLTPPQMRKDDLLTILLDYFPSKIILDVTDIDPVLDELRAFWLFIKREYGLRNARACLRVLNQRTAQHMALAIEGYDIDPDYDDLTIRDLLDLLLDTGAGLGDWFQRRLGRR